MPKYTSRIRCECGWEYEAGSESGAVIEQECDRHYAAHRARDCSKAGEIARASLRQ